MTGFKIKETMEGYHHFLGEPRGTQRPMKFEVDWGVEDLNRWFFTSLLSGRLAPFKMEGKITIEGLCKDEPVDGTLLLDYLLDNTITYTLFFNLNEHLNEQIYKYEGKKVNIKPWNLLTSHTTCFGTLTKIAKGKQILISKSVLFFKMKTIFDFLRSFRLILVF